MQLARQLQPEWQREYRPWQRKILEAGSANVLMAVHDNDSRKLAHTYLSVAPFGVAYGDLRGIAAAADVLFGVDALALSPTQCALLIVLLPKRLNLVAGTPAERQAAWSERVGVARQFLQSQRDRWGQSAIDELDRWAVLPQRQALAGLSDAAQLNLGARTRALVLPHLSRIAADQPTGLPGLVRKAAGLEQASETFE